MKDSDFLLVWDWVLEVGDMIASIYRSDFLIRDKGGNDPVTEADLQASEFLAEKIHTFFPTHGFLSEEKKDSPERLTKEWVWILDPIDGTREFVKRNDQFALSLGLVRFGIPIWGVVFNPATGEFFTKFHKTFVSKLSQPYATEQNKELLQIDGNQVTEPNYVDAPNPSKKPILLVSDSESKEGLFSDSFWKEYFDLRPMGSIAYKLGLLSAGFVDLIVSLKPKNEWDICGGIALLPEDNFIFHPLLEEPYAFNKESTLSYGLVAGKKWATTYLFNHISKSELSARVKLKW